MIAMFNRRVARFIVLIGVLIVSAGCGLFSSGPGQTVKNFYYAVESGKIDEARNLLSAQVAAAYGAKLSQALVQASEDIKQRGGITSIDILTEDVNGDIANVTSKTTFGNGQSTTDASRLLKEDGEWKISPSK